MFDLFNQEKINEMMDRELRREIEEEYEKKYEKERISMVKTVMTKLGCSAAEAMSFLGFTEDEQKKVISLFE